MPRLFSYCVARDYGFAPNPFYGWCTLATCKPIIRRMAQAGDVIIGTGSKALQGEGRLIYAMRVAEGLTFDQYWSDPRFQLKKPNLAGSLKKRFGDNIYHKTTGGWIQIDSHHSFADGSPNPKNLKTDTGTDRVLIANDFVYFGIQAPVIPKRFRNYHGIDICHKRGHKSIFPKELISEFFDYFDTLERGYAGAPANWK